MATATTYKVYVYNQQCKLAGHLVTQNALEDLISEDKNGEEVVSDDIYLWGEGTEAQLVAQAEFDSKSSARHVYAPALNVLRMFRA